jgi:hypothetical protein
MSADGLSTYKGEFARGVKHGKGILVSMVGGAAPPRAPLRPARGGAP